MVLPPKTRSWWTTRRPRLPRSSPVSAPLATEIGPQERKHHPTVPNQQAGPHGDPAGLHIGSVGAPHKTEEPHRDPPQTLQGGPHDRARLVATSPLAFFSAAGA